MQLTKFQKLCIIYTKGKGLSVADIFSRSLLKKNRNWTSWNMKLRQPIRFASLTKDKQTKTVH